jgi:hypothetical protein
MARISDVLDCNVVDADGHRIGKVRDVRLVMDGPVEGALARLRLDAVIVGGMALAGRLGYLRGGVRGPALLKAVMSRLERRAATYPIGEIGDWDLTHHRLHLVRGARAEEEPDA